MTGLTEAAFQGLLPSFAQAFVSDMQDRTIDGQPRTRRRDSTSETCPVPTMADTRLFILTYVNQHLLQDIQGQLFGMSQSHANTWMHLLHPVWHHTLADQELLPAHTAQDLATMFTTTPTDRSATSPLLFMMGLHVPSSGPQILRNRKSMTAARRQATRATTSW